MYSRNQLQHPTSSSPEDDSKSSSSSDSIYSHYDFPTTPSPRRAARNSRNSRRRFAGKRRVTFDCRTFSVPLTPSARRNRLRPSPNAERSTEVPCGSYKMPKPCLKYPTSFDTPSTIWQHSVCLNTEASITDTSCHVYPCSLREENDSYPPPHGFLGSSSTVSSSPLQTPTDRHDRLSFCNSLASEDRVGAGFFPGFQNLSAPAVLAADLENDFILSSTPPNPQDAFPSLNPDDAAPCQPIDIDFAAFVDLGD